MRCSHCGQPITFGQLQLTKEEKARKSWSGDPNGTPNIIEAQCVKAAAKWYGVDDWMAYWDPTLSVEENYDIMAEQGWKDNERTMREMVNPNHV